MRFSLPVLTLASGLVAGLGACAASSGPPIPDKFGERSPVIGNHDGPPVDPGQAGTARFVHPLLDAFDAEAAMSVTTFLDGFYRAPGSDGYEASIEEIRSALFGAGFGVTDGYGLSVVSRPMETAAWTPRSASLRVAASDEALAKASKRGARWRAEEAGEVELLSFEHERESARVMLPLGAPGCRVAGPLVLELGAVKAGDVLLTERPLLSVEEDAVAAGAAAVLSDYTLPYCVDPSGEKRGHDAIFSGRVRPGATLPSFQISRRAGEFLRTASPYGARVRLEAQVSEQVRPLRVVLATIEGAERPDETVFVLGHVDGAGANDNAAGAGGVAELALTVKRLIASGVLERPRRSLCFVFGTEQGAGAMAVAEVGGAPVAAIVADMIAADAERSGAGCLLERGWDPASVYLLPPDAHTPRGSEATIAKDIVPNGLSIICREALIDVSYAEAARGGERWSTREHPWEGGGDHDAFLAAGTAAALFWHFTDFSYQTSLDRMDMVDPAELRRTAVAVGAAALAVADARPLDLERHLDTLNLELHTRLDAVVREEAGPAAERLWKDWFRGARFWLKALTAGEGLPEPRALDLVSSAPPE